MSTRRAEVILSFDVTTPMTVQSDGFGAVRVTLPEGVQMAGSGNNSGLTIDSLPSIQDQTSVSPTGVAVPLRLGAQVTVSTASLRFPVLLPSQEPDENVWLLELCGEVACLRNTVLRFPLPGISSAEQPPSDVEQAQATHLRPGQLTALVLILANT